MKEIKEDRVLYSLVLLPFIAFELWLIGPILQKNYGRAPVQTVAILAVPLAIALVYGARHYRTRLFINVFGEVLSSIAFIGGPALAVLNGCWGSGEICRWMCAEGLGGIPLAALVTLICAKIDPNE